jgi:nucleotide-binding universal stress UspA family protein
MLHRILTAVDGSEHSQKALEFAAQLALKFGAELHVVHVPQGAAEDRVMFLGGASVTLHAPREAVEKAGHTLIEAAEHIARELGVDQVTTELLAGDPAKQIVDCAERIAADTIVLGSRGLGDFGGLLLGSVSHKVAHTAPCTCITVR